MHDNKLPKFYLESYQKFKDKPLVYYYELGNKSCTTNIENYGNWIHLMEADIKYQNV